MVERIEGNAARTQLPLTSVRGSAPIDTLSAVRLEVIVHPAQTFKVGPAIRSETGGTAGNHGAVPPREVKLVHCLLVKTYSARLTPMR